MANGQPDADVPEPRGPEEPTDAPATERAAVPAAGSAPEDAPTVIRPPDVRVGDVDRKAALQALDRHMEEGRLGVDEYGDRSAAASMAVTRSDLADLFADLPAPHPPLPSAAGVPAPAAGRYPLRHDHGSRRLSPAMLALGFGLVVMLAVVPALAMAGAGFHGGGLIFLPLLFMVMGGGFGRRGRGPHH